MSFMYRREPAKIDRTSKREDDFIHKNIVRALDHLVTVMGGNYIKILPVRHRDPPFNKAEPESSLATYAIKELGLSWFEVEHWLDEVSLRDQVTFYLEIGSVVNIDERRMLYKRQGYVRNSIVYRFKQLQHH